MLTPVGNRILVRPIQQDAQHRQILDSMRSGDEFLQRVANEMTPVTGNNVVIVTTVAPVCGRVVRVGRPFCAECRTEYTAQVHPGDVVVYPRTAGQELTMNGETYLLMRPDEVLVKWTPEPEDSL